jgi:hypothetical protein
MLNRYKDDITESQQRVEAWWQHEIIDRAVIQVTAPRTRVPEADDPAGDALDLAELEKNFTDPARVIPRLKYKLANTYFGGEAFPVMFPVSINMVAILGNYLGCPMKFVSDTTTWSDPIVDDWEQRPAYTCDFTNHWWQVTERLLTEAVEQANGYYYVGVPDLNGPTEILSQLRDPQRLAIDFIDRPHCLKPAIAEINQAWFEYWQACTKITQRTGGYFYWMGIWSERPSIDLQSDFSCMISKKMFDAYFLPFLEEQTLMVDRTIYHLDGPGAIRHLDSLLALEHLDGIQWIPGAGAKPAVEWMPLLQKIQYAGKLVVVYCEPDHVPRFLQELQPEGLMMITSCHNEEEARQLVQNVQKWT